MSFEVHLNGPAQSNLLKKLSPAINFINKELESAIGRLAISEIAMNSAKKVYDEAINNMSIIDNFIFEFTHSNSYINELYDEYENTITVYRLSIKTKENLEVIQKSFNSIYNSIILDPTLIILSDDIINKISLASDSTRWWD